jgi:hypothetical protein
MPHKHAQFQAFCGMRPSIKHKIDTVHPTFNAVAPFFQETHYCHSQFMFLSRSKETNAMFVVNAMFVIFFKKVINLYKFLWLQFPLQQKLYKGRTMSVILSNSYLSLGRSRKGQVFEDIAHLACFTSSHTTTLTTTTTITGTTTG